MTTRYQGDTGTVFLPGVRGHALDPSQSPAGTTCKTIFDCTAPFHLKERFRRAEFVEVDLEKYGIERY
jgi:4-hydroxy-3-polyprenylbenzoate decarboxylase